MSEKRSPPKKDKASSSVSVKTPPSSSKQDSKHLKRKLFIAGAATADEEERKATTPKRRRSIQSEVAPVSSTVTSAVNRPIPSLPQVVSSSVSASSSTLSDSATTPIPSSNTTASSTTSGYQPITNVTSALSPSLTTSGAGSKARHAPLSERQQIAKIMQQYADEESKHTGGDLSPKYSLASPPLSASKRTPFDKKVSKRNEKGETKLHYAAIKGDVKLTKKLIKSGAVVNEKDNAGWTPLHEACNRGHLHVAKHLLKNGANINVLGLENDTPLHDASINGHLKLIELLLRHGANPLQCNSAGKTPIDVAPNENVLKLLKSETIASCSSSESVTSEVRSPTSPESNASDDEREEDAKRRKDSPVSEHPSLFMPRSSNMISSIGGSAPSIHPGQGSSSSTSHSPTSTTTISSAGASSHTTATTPSKLPAIDPYAYHDENDDSDLSTGHLPCSSTTPVRSRPLSNIHVARIAAADKGKGLGMSYSHHKKSAGSPKRGATSQLHHEEPKKAKTYGNLFHSADKNTTKGKFSSATATTASSTSSSSVFELSIGSSAGQRTVSPTPSQSSQDSDLYDPQLSGETSSKLKNKETTPGVSPLTTGKVSSSDHLSTDSRSQKIERHGNNTTTAASGRYSSIKTAENTLQPDSQMPKLSQESGAFTPSRLSEDDNFDALSDSDDNPLHIDVDSTTTTVTTPTKSATPKRSNQQQAKHIPTSTSKYQAASSGHSKSDVSSSNYTSSSTLSGETKMSSSSRQSPQTTGNTSPYHFTDSPCSLTTLSYKQERVERNKEAAAAAAGASTGVSVSSTSSRYEKHGEQQPAKRHCKSEKLTGKTKESLSTPSEHVSQSDNNPQLSKSADSTVSPGDQRLPASSIKTSSELYGSSKADTTSIGIKQEIKEEVDSSYLGNTGDNIRSSIQDDKVDLKPLTIKIEKEPVKSFRHESERSKSPKGYDSGISSRRNSPKLVDSNRASPKSFSFKDTFPSNSPGMPGKSGLPTGSKWDLSNRSSPKSDRDSPKSDKSDSSSNGGAPKVPPLKIILPQKATSTTDRPQSTKVTTQQKGNLPYVLNPTQDSAAEEAIDSSSFVTSATPGTFTGLAESSAASPMSVKPSRNSSRASSIASGEQEGMEKASSSTSLPFTSMAVTGEDSNSGGIGMTGVSSSQDTAQQKRLTRSRQLDRDIVRNNDEDSRDSKPDTRSEAGADSKEDISERRVTRSQMRSQHGKKDNNGNSRDSATVKEVDRDNDKEGSVSSGTAVSVSDSSSVKATSVSGSSAVTTIQVVTTGSSTTVPTPSVSSQSNIMTQMPSIIQPSQTTTSTDEIIVHPRKRKALRHRANQEQSCTVDTSFNLFPKNSTSEKTANPYEMFLDIRKKVAQRRTDMTVVTPKAPTGFSNYLMVSCKYILQGSSASSAIQNIPTLQTPTALPEPMKELFADQEKTRYKLRLQHMIEREKLRLSIEQEVLRVHGRAARALANQTTPLSVCAILRDEEIYNVIDPEAEEKDKIGARSRYNGRQFLSWLQDVDDKYEKIKESLLMRHHHEAESLHAVQKLEWEWKLKEATLCDYNKTPDIDNSSVPMVIVNDDFELLPS